ncbi:unnamed protein product [Adineta ricciae]|uniref:Uncharacterized protein n=1 Tax=Adineta ricciae TaxID=249248 RepID=A0A813X4Y9_ADIRI|nr:unnamed protein product [Adineta ricciae]
MSGTDVQSRNAIINILCTSVCIYTKSNLASRHICLDKCWSKSKLYSFSVIVHHQKSITKIPLIFNRHTQANHIVQLFSALSQSVIVNFMSDPFSCIHRCEASTNKRYVS